MSKPMQRADIDAMDKRRRANFINSLSGYKSANLLGSINAQGQTNLALMSSVFHIGASCHWLECRYDHIVPRPQYQRRAA